MGSQTAGNEAQSPTPGGTTLRGRIEAIGIHDLLRVSMAKGSTGRLLVFNDDYDAELYYEDGHLVAAVSGSKTGPECLQETLQMRQGEFEFASGLVTESLQKTPILHDNMLSAIKAYYEGRVRTQKAPSRPLPAEEAPLSSGVHKVSDKNAPAANTPAAPAASAPAAETAATSDSAVGELGAAKVDASGRVLSRQGAISDQDGALAALSLRLATAFGAQLGVRDLQRFEIHATKDKVLACVVAADGLRICKLSNSTDVDGAWKRLKS